LSLCRGKKGVEFGKTIYRQIKNGVELYTMFGNGLFDDPGMHV
jgi:hypothetical protein